MWRQYDIIELSKAKRQIMDETFNAPKGIKDWVTFLINPKEMEESNMGEMSKEVKKAYEQWQNLNLSEEEREELCDLVPQKIQSTAYERNTGIE